ncbi:MAG: hemerythrin domain-containing protein [Candidatus Marinimicrobia bacterium]|nr:hemerythrin domain-containing protein [Candidatus Neomarinimicrobiota bacterium]
MSRFEWTEALEIDKGQIDADHKKLIEIANEMACLDDLDNQGEELRRSIRKLYEYVKNHFTREEAFMLALDYPGKQSTRINMRRSLGE